MYPASRLGPRSGPRGSVSRLISLLAALTLLYGGLVVLLGMAPGPGHLVAVGSTPSWVCQGIGSEFGGKNPAGGGAQIRCRYVPDDARIPQRVAIALATLVAASALFAAASRVTRVRPALA